MSRQELFQLVIDAVNTARQENGQAMIDLTPVTRLIGDGAVLDSTSFIMVLVGLEADLTKRGIAVDLTENEAVFDPEGPFQTIDSLCDFLTSAGKTNA
jgi:hypothetical protein